MEGAICCRASAGFDGPLKGVFASFSNPKGQSTTRTDLNPPRETSELAKACFSAGANHVEQFGSTDCVYLRKIRGWERRGPVEALDSYPFAKAEFV
jgi:hypothetical protein